MNFYDDDNSDGEGIEDYTDYESYEQIGDLSHLTSFGKRYPELLDESENSSSYSSSSNFRSSGETASKSTEETEKHGRDTMNRSESTSSSLDCSTDDSKNTERRRTAYKQKRLMRKAPDAPKRFKSAYICFVIENMENLKQNLLPTELKVALEYHLSPIPSHSINYNVLLLMYLQVTALMKVLANMWRDLPTEKRAEYYILAEKDKNRYMTEMKNFKGPTHIPNKRTKKPPVGHSSILSPPFLNCL
jgi:hypothetical protein